MFSLKGLLQSSALALLTSLLIAPVGAQQVITVTSVNFIGASNYPAPYSFTTVAGESHVGSADGIGSAARFSSPIKVAVDSAGNAYVADADNHTIRKVTPAGVVTTFAGLAGKSGSADGTGSAARFHFPEDVAVDAAGNLYVADAYNCTIRKITAAGVVTTLAGTAGETGHSDGAGVAARFYFPLGVAVDQTGAVYVADTYNAAIRKITAAGVVTTLAGGEAGYSDGTGVAAKFMQPCGLAVDTVGVVYVADSGNAAIRKITPSGVVTTYAGGAMGSNDGVGGAAQFSYPSGVAVGPAGVLYVADTGNSTIRQITSAGAVTTFAGAAGATGSTDGTRATARFISASGVAVDGTGNIYVADTDNATIRKISSDGIVSTVAGLGFYNAFAAADGLGSYARFTYIAAMVVSPSGDSYAADYYAHTIRKITPAGVVTTVAGSAGVSGNVDGVGSAARFNSPVGLALDAAGNLYVADSENFLIRKITPSGVVSTVPSNAGFYYPYGVAADGAGNLYVADTGNSTIRKISPLGTVTTLAGTAGMVGSTDGVGSGALFQYPEALVVDVLGNVYVADTSNSTIRKITAAGVVTTLAGAAQVTGRVDGIGTNARFDEPRSLAIDAAGNLYVADTNNRTIRKITPAGEVSTIAGQSDGSSHIDGVGNGAVFFLPGAIAADALGNLLVGDYTTVRKGVLAGAPVFSTQPQSQSVAAGGSAAFSSLAACVPAPTYQWYFNGAAISGATGAGFSLSGVQSGNAGNYTVVATNELGSVTSNVAVLTVTAAPIPPVSGGGGGGGALSLWFCLALAGLGAIRAWVARVSPAPGD